MDEKINKKTHEGQRPAIPIAIGIDLGTSYSVIGVWKDNRVEIISNNHGTRTMPSYVAFTNQEKLVGHSAKNQANINSENTLYDVKRLIGRNFSDKILQKDLSLLPYKVQDDGNDKPIINVKYKDEIKKFYSEEISGFVLSELKKIAEEYVGQEIKQAVISVPAYFNNACKEATIRSAELAGLEVLRILNEPTAASLCYGINDEDKNEKNILVVDIGGGTSDFTLLTIEDNLYEVKAIVGDSHLGGSDIDNNLVKHFIDEFKRKNKKVSDISLNNKAIKKLRTASEKVKINLS
jgi:L1 cell adhesion molecule like protein